MSELNVLWYKNISRIGSFLALILLLVMEFCEMVIWTWSLFGNQFSVPRQVHPDTRKFLIWLIKSVWNCIFVWFIINSCVGIRKKRPDRLKPFLFALIIMLVGIVIRLILWRFIQESNSPNAKVLLAAFNTNLYWFAMNLQPQSAHLDQIVLCNILQIGVGCCFFVTIYFNYEVLRYEAIHYHCEEIIGNVMPIDLIHLKAKPNEYVKCHTQGTNRIV